MNIDEIGGYGGNGRRFSHELALPAQITQTIRQIITPFGQSSISPSRPVVTQPEETPAKPSGSGDIVDDQQPRAGPGYAAGEARSVGPVGPHSACSHAMNSWLPRESRVNPVAPGPIWTPLQVSGGRYAGKA